MQILIDITRSSDGRPTGTARRPDLASEGLRFAGVMELVACLEQLCATASHPSEPSGSDPGSCHQAPPAPAATQQPKTEGSHHG
jgi:hypothetical protein